MISIRALGPIEITVGGDPAPPELLQRKNLALLVYLERSPGRRKSREHLMGLLWGDKPEDKARHSLREAVRVLRRIVGEEGLTGDANWLRLAAGIVELDVHSLDTLMANGAWREAAALVRGEFLEGLTVKNAWPFEEWLQAERLHWREASLKVLTGHAEECLARGDTLEALRAAERAQLLDPGDAPALRTAMKALALSGNRSAALARYEAFRTRLNEVASQPDADTQRLAEQIGREREWRLAASVPTEAAAGAELRRAPLVGREDELARLVGAWETSRRSGAASVAVIEGDVGYGKTRLAEELMARARLDGATVVAVRSVAGDLERPASNILGLARGGMLDAPGLAAAMPAALEAFAREIPEWRDRFGATGAGTQPLEAALVEVLRVSAGEEPVLLCVDDAQWCDSATLSALSAALRDLCGLPLCICLCVTTAEPRPELDNLRSRIGRDIRGAAVTLGRLDLAALNQLAAWAVPEYTAEQLERLIRRIALDSAGLPLLAVELLHAVALGLDLDETAGAWPQPQRTLSQTLPGDLPDTIVAAIRMGFRRLSEAAQQALTAVAVLGDQATPRQVERATGLRGQALDSALDELEWQRWLVADARGYSFLARIVRGVVESDMVTEGQRLRIRESAAG